MSTSTPNILYILLDQLRADHLGSYGHPYGKTPHIDLLATEGMRFDQAFSNNPVCVPTRISLLTSLYSHQTGTVESQYERPPGLYERLKFRQTMNNAGYRKIINVGKVHTGFTPAECGFDLSFDRQDGQGATWSRLPHSFDPAKHCCVQIPGDPPGPIIGGVYPGREEETYSSRLTDCAIEALEQLDNQPWLLRFSLCQPHPPVLPPEPYASMYNTIIDDPPFDEKELEHRVPLLREWRTSRGFDRLTAKELRIVRSSYLGMVTFVDAQIGRLLSALEARGLRKNLLTVLISDHGGSLGDHGCQVKGPYDSQDLTRVPMIYNWPGKIPAGRVFPHLVQLLDFLPTLSDLVGGPILEQFEGTSLKAAILGTKTDAIHDAIFCEGAVYDKRRETVRTPNWRYTRYPELQQDELIDLKKDPGETRDVKQMHPNVVRDMRHRLEQWLKETPYLFSTRSEVSIEDE